jgi:hypothetical protein
MEANLMPGYSDLRQALQADGADLEMEGVTDGVATIRLILGPEACLECIMPKDTLEKMLLVSLRQADDVSSVDLLDPRLDPSWAPPAQ